jgi:hypothetical protein
MIDLALRPKLRLLDLDGKSAGGVARGGLPANRPKEPLFRLRWTGALDPKIYEGNVFQSKQLFDLKRGDRMLVGLFRDSTGVRFERNLLADELPKPRVHRGEDWVLGLPYYHAAVTTGGNQLALTATLERPRDRSAGQDGNLQQTRPGFVWWEVTPKSGEKPTTVRVAERPQLPAPAWDVTVAGWPGSPTNYRPAGVKAWANVAPPPAAYELKIDPARLAAGVVPLEVDGPDGKVQVFASLEDWQLKADFKPGPPAPVSCLVLRIQHPDKKPVFVRPAGFDFTAYEQRYYPPSAAVTAVFGPVTRDQLDARLQGRPLELELVSVERFKAAAPAVGLELEPAVNEQPLVDPPKLGEDAGKAK